MDITEKPTIAVVIPCYKVSRHINDVLQGIGPEVSLIYCVDDGCPENTGSKVKEAFANDARVQVLTHSQNQGVGAAVITGYKAAADDGADIIVKIDGDGQMDPALIPEFIDPILKGTADYVKGNRFYHLKSLRSMPLLRKIGNSGLSFLSKISTGYWSLFDPTNGFTAIHSSIVRELPLEKIYPRFFFETDILFHLNLLRAVVLEVPMDAVYSDQGSNLNPWRALAEFPALHFRNFVIRLTYSYFLRNFSVASVDFLLGSIFFLFGVIFGLTTWISNARLGVATTSGTVMISALPIILGFQLLLGFINYDIANIPGDPIHQRLKLHSQLKKHSRPKDISE